MPQIIPTKKSYHDWKGRPSPIRNVGRLLTSGWIVPISNGSGGPFNGRGNGPLGGGSNGLPKGGDNSPLRGGGNNPLRGGNSKHPTNQNPRSYAAWPASPWIGPTQNLWYPSWYHVQPPITPNPPSSRKSLPYPIYIIGMDLDGHICVFCKAI
jgi:hypothetical protein